MNEKLIKFTLPSPEPDEPPGDAPSKARILVAEDDPVSLWLDTPYQISKIVGEFYSNYYFKAHRLPVVKARFQNVSR